MKNKLYFYIAGIILMGLILPLIIAETENYKINEETNLILTCSINNAIPSGSATMNLTIAYPNGSLFINNKQATSLGNGIFNYTITFPILGTYHPTLICIDGANSNSNSAGTYEVTGNGKATPEGIVIILFIIIFIIIIGAFLFQLILSIGHFASLDLDVLDLAKTMGIYFMVLAIYYFNGFYFGNTYVDSFLLILVRIGGFTHVLIPIIGFLISITIGSLKKRKVDFGTRRIYRRQKIGN